MDTTVNPILERNPLQLSWAELKEYIAAVSLQMKETDRRIEASRKETERLFRESLLRMDKADKKLRNLNDQFVSQTGHILEGLTRRSALRALQKAGFKVNQSFKELTGSDSELGLNMEIDLLYVDTTEAIAVEVKTQCTKSKINHFLKQMRHFKRLYPRFADLEVYVAIAALNYAKDSEFYAREKGLIVIQANDDIFTIDPVEKEKLLKF